MSRPYSCLSPSPIGLQAPDISTVARHLWPGYIAASLSHPPQHRELPQPQEPPRTRPTHITPTTHNNLTPNTMMPPPSQSARASDWQAAQSYIYVPDLDTDYSASISNFGFLDQDPNSSHPNLIMATPIDDDDLTFGDKPLCQWYEEERRKLSTTSATSDYSMVSDASTSSQEDQEEMRRGRQRERPGRTDSPFVGGASAAQGHSYTHHDHTGKSKKDAK